MAGQPLRPEDFAVTLAAVVASDRDAGDVPLRRGELEAEEFVANDRPASGVGSSSPRISTAPHMMELAKLQAWTIKPAVLRKTN